MTKIFLLIENASTIEKVKASLFSKDNLELIDSVGNIEDILTQINHFLPDIILIDKNYENCEFVIRQIKSSSVNQNIQIILLVNNNDECNFMNLADGFIEYPINESILISAINSHCKIKKSLDRLYENNKELSRSLYQLNVLYNTSSQFTGTLNTSKLYDIMLEAMEKTLSFDVACAVILNPQSQSIFNLNTIHTPSDNLINALKIRSILNCKNVIEQENLALSFDFDDMQLIQKIKQKRSNKIFGMETISYDSLFAPIKIGNEFFGIIEIFRQVPFLPEDVTCFQAIAHQVALPLRSAKLYEEISTTNQKLEKLEKLKSEFVSIVSHELRTPLTPINNSLEIVLSGQTGEISSEAKNFISMAKRNIQRLSGIIEDLLDLSRIQKGKLDFRYKLVDITSSLELLQKTFMQVADEKDINIKLNINCKLPEIYADIRRIEQIFTNLVSNAIKFTSNNGIVEVSASIVDSSQINVDNLVSPISEAFGKYIKVSVIDDGVGIKKEDIPKIFDKFSQIESSLNRNKGGVGLGLTITKQLIDSHLGLIEVLSEEQHGSSFNVYLPLFNEFNAFVLDLSHTLVSNDEVGIIKIAYDGLIDVIDILKDNKLLNLTKISKELFVKYQNRNEYYVYIPKISLSSFDALCSSLIENCAKIKDKEHDIILCKAHSSRNGTDALKIINMLLEG